MHHSIGNPRVEMARQLDDDDDGGGDRSINNKGALLTRRDIGKRTHLFDDDEEGLLFTSEIDSLIEKKFHQLVKDLEGEEENRPKRQTSNHNLVSSIIGVKRQSSDINVYNTGTLHLQAIVIIDNSLNKSDSPYSFSKKAYRWTAASLSLLSLCFQFVVLYWLIIETTYPACSMHSDCSIGKYCEPNVSVSSVPRCADCNGNAMNGNHLPWDDNDCNFEYYHGLNEDNVMIWVSGDKVFHPAMNQTAIDCLAISRCILSNIDYEKGDVEFDTMYPKCDFLHLVRTKVTWSTYMSLIFICLIYATLLHEDIRESMREERVMDYVMKEHHDFSNPNLMLPFLPSCEVMYLSLRMRKFVLPWWVAGATTGIIATESVSTKTLLLNLITIAFITEVDNYLAKFFLSVSNHRDAKRLADQVQFAQDTTKPLCSHSNNKYYNYWRPRILTLLPMIALISALSHPQEVISSFLPLANNCDGFSSAVGVLFLFYCQYPVITIETLLASLMGGPRNFASKSLLFAFELSRNVAIMYVSGCLWALAGRFLFRIMDMHLVLLFLSMLYHLCFHGLFSRLRFSNSVVFNLIFPLIYVGVGFLMFIYHMVIIFRRGFPSWYSSLWGN